MKKYEKILKNNGFTVSNTKQYDKTYEVWFYQYTPEGEDWNEYLYLDKNTNEEFEEKLRERIYYFDVDSEAEPYIAIRGTRGVPNSISAIIEDAKWKLEKLQTVLNKLNEELN